MRLLSTKIIIVLWVIFLPMNAMAQDAGSLFSIGQSLYENAQYEQAANNFKESGQLYLQQKDSIKWVRSSYRYGDAMMSAGNIQEGLNALLSIDEHKPKQTPLDLKALIKNYIGWAYRQLEQYDNSKEYYLHAIELADISGDSVLIGRLNNNISYPYLYSGDYERAFSYQKKAKEIYESAGEDYRLSFVLNGMFSTLYQLGLHSQGDKYIRQSAAIREDIGNPNLLDVAYHNMAANFNALGKRDSAIIYYQKSLELSQMLQNPFDITQTLMNIGDLYKHSGDHENALLYYDEALVYNRETNRPESIARNISKIADIASLEGDYQTAEAFINDAFSALESAPNSTLEPELHLELAELHLIQSNYSEAEQNIQQGLQAVDGKNIPSVKIEGQRLLGKLHRQKGNFEESLNYYNNAHKISSRQFVQENIASTIDLAKAYRKVNPDSAFILADRAFELIDSVRTNVVDLNFKAGFFSDHAIFYNEVAEWYLAVRNNPEKALELVGYAKSRVLMDELAEAENKIFDTLDETALIKKQQLLKGIDRLHQQINSAQDPAEQQLLRTELRDLEFRYQTYLNELRQQVPKWKNFDYPEPLTPKQVMAMLDKETALVEYAFSDENLIRFFVTHDDISASVYNGIEDTTAAELLTGQVRLFRDHVTAGGSLADLSEVSDPLFNTLFPHQQAQANPRISQLVIIPDASLSFLPFEALYDGSQYLIEKYNIKYLPAASIYPLLQSPHRVTESQLFAVAGSGFESGDNLISQTSSQSNFASLPFTLLEVDSILVNFDRYNVLKNEDVTEAYLKSQNLGDYQFLHFATHGTIDEVNPSQSGLILSKRTETESLFGEDGFLNSSEIAGLTLNADLVVLSACNTGMGKIVTGEGLLGLQRSFLSAGASSVMVSLWNVFDRSTSIFMSSFYKNMLAHQHEDYGLWEQTLDWFGMHTHPVFDYKANALRDTKLAMIKHPYYNHPIHWAPFVLIGK
jgi:CHAT domain-containing protein